MSPITDEERRMMRHAVGASERRGKDGYRNRYVAPTRNPAWERLVSIGYAVCLSSHGLDRAGAVQYAVTREGCAAIGLSKAATIRACGTDEEQRALEQSAARRNEARRERLLPHAENDAAIAIQRLRRAFTKAERALTRLEVLGAEESTIERLVMRFNKAVDR